MAAPSTLPASSPFSLVLDCSSPSSASIGGCVCAASSSRSSECLSARLSARLRATGFCERRWLFSRTCRTRPASLAGSLTGSKKHCSPYVAQFAQTGLWLLHLIFPHGQYFHPRECLKRVEPTLRLRQNEHAAGARRLRLCAGEALSVRELCPRSIMHIYCIDRKPWEREE